MKKLFYFLAAAIALTTPLSLTSCMGDSPTETYKEWREKNDAYMIEKEAAVTPDGEKEYTRINCAWDPSAYVLMKWHNNRALTAMNLKPISTSTVDVKYKLTNIEGIGIDSSYRRTTPADSIYRSVLKTNIQGWIIALGQMHVGDSCTVIIPYNQGYGLVSNGKLSPYSDLIFSVKLAGIPAYEKPLK